MKTYALMVSGLVLLSGCAHTIKNSAFDASFKRPSVIKMAALPAYTNDANHTEFDVTYAVASEFMRAGWKMVDRSLVNQIMEEQKFQLSGAVEKNAVQIGRMTGANLVMTGTYSDHPSSHLYLRVVDVETGEIVATTTCYGDSSLGACAAKELVRLIERKK